MAFVTEVSKRYKYDFNPFEKNGMVQIDLQAPVTGGSSTVAFAVEQGMNAPGAEELLGHYVQYHVDKEQTDPFDRYRIFIELDSPAEEGSGTEAMIDPEGLVRPQGPILVIAAILVVIAFIATLVGALIWSVRNVGSSFLGVPAPVILGGALLVVATLASGRR